MKYIVMLILILLTGCEDTYKEGYYDLGPNLKCINGHVYQVTDSKVQGIKLIIPLLDGTKTHEQCPKSIKY